MPVLSSLQLLSLGFTSTQPGPPGFTSYPDDPPIWEPDSPSLVTSGLPVKGVLAGDGGVAVGVVVLNDGPGRGSPLESVAVAYCACIDRGGRAGAFLVDAFHCFIPVGQVLRDMF